MFSAPIGQSSRVLWKQIGGAANLALGVGVVMEGFLEEVALNVSLEG